MTSSTYVSRYERRLNLVVDAIRGEHPASPGTVSPGSAMSEQAARVLAVRVLEALDHIPETVR
jgi:hypothetical protein